MEPDVILMHCLTEPVSSVFPYSATPGKLAGIISLRLLAFTTAANGRG